MLLSATLFWGLSYSVQTMVSDRLGTFTIVFVKGLGGVLLYPVLKMMKKRIDAKTLFYGAVIGILAFLGLVFQQKGLESSTVSKASFITALYIVIVPLIEVFSGRKMKMRMLGAILVAVAGLYFLCFSGTMTFLIGDLLLLICSLVFAFEIILIDRYSKRCDPLALTFTTQLSVAILSGTIMMIREKPMLTDFSEAILPILFLTLLPGMFSQSVQILYSKDVGPTLASLLMSLESVFGALGGWLILHQTLSFREIIGCILVFLSILLAE